MKKKNSMVERSLKSFPSGTGSGPSLCSADRLKCLLKLRDPERKSSFISALTSVVQLLINGNAPASLAHLLAGARLIALKKDDNGIRPIAIGEILRRLVSKIAFNHVYPSLSAIFHNSQLGVGSKGGCEAIAHTMTSLMATLTPEARNTVVLLQIDWENAFNSFRRTPMFEEVRKLNDEK